MELLLHHFKITIPSSNEEIGDIYDGLIYMAFFCNPFHVSFTLNYDGAPKFKSSGMQLWPVHVNELPPLFGIISTCTSITFQKKQEIYAAIGDMVLHRKTTIVFFFGTPF